MTRRHPGVLGRSRHLLTLLTKNHKNRAVMAALPDLTGRRVLDIGCNAGLYSCYSSMRGADAVLGIDMDVGRIEQARLVRDIFRGQGRVTGRVDFERIDITERPALVEEFDAILACCVLYHLGPVDELKRHIRQSAAELLIVQCNVVRGDRIGAKNRPGVAGHESGAKTWGNILGTVAGARAFMADCGFAVERITAARRQHPVLRGRRVRD